MACVIVRDIDQETWSVDIRYIMPVIDDPLYHSPILRYSALDL